MMNANGRAYTLEVEQVSEQEAIEIIDLIWKELYKPKKAQEALDTAISALKEVQQYRKIGTVEACVEALEKLSKAEKALNAILSGNYNDECKFCVHNDNPMANCNCLSGDGSWCMHNAKWNGKTSDTDDLEEMEDGA